MIEGKYTFLRAIEISDLEQLRNWRNIQEFRINFREHRELNLKNQNDWFNVISSNQNDFMFMIIDKNTNEAVGACGLLYTNWIIRSADFSFYIGFNKLYIDEKYASDATESLLKFGFNDLNLNKIWMELYEFDNKKLDFFKDKFKFQVDGKLRQNSFAKGKYWDSYIISLLKTDFDLSNNE
jgi:RimJ/RimL family protein N-acetyltransferase